MIRCVCLHCSTAHVLDNLMVGQAFTCPDCGRRLRVPSHGTKTATRFVPKSADTMQRPLTVLPAAPKKPPQTPISTPKKPAAPSTEAARRWPLVLGLSVIGFSAVCILLAIILFVYFERREVARTPTVPPPVQPSIVNEPLPPVVDVPLAPDSPERRKKKFTTKELVAEVERRRLDDTLQELVGQNLVVTGTVAFVSDRNDDGWYVVTLNARGDLPASDSVLISTGQFPVPVKG